MHYGRVVFVRADKKPCSVFDAKYLDTHLETGVFSWCRRDEPRFCLADDRIVPQMELKETQIERARELGYKPLYDSPNCQN